MHKITLTRDKREMMGAIEDQALTVHTNKNYKKKEKKGNYHHNKKDKKQKKIKRDPSNVNAILVMKMDTLKEIVPSRKRDTMLILSKMMNQQNKNSNERRMIQMKSMC